MDFSDITGAVALTAVVGGILAMGAIKIAPLVAKWGTAKLLSMFGR